MTTVPTTQPAAGSTPPAGQQPLHGRIVEHQGGGPVEHAIAENTSRTRQTIAHLHRLCHGLTTAPGEIHDWLLDTEDDLAISQARAAGQSAVAIAGRKEQEAIMRDRRARLARFLTEIGSVAVPVFFGGWFWFTATAFLVGLVTLSLQRSKTMPWRVVVRFLQVTGISLLLEVILAAFLGVHPTPVVVTPMGAPWVLLIPVGVWGLLTFGPALANDGKVKAAEIVTWSKLGVPAGVVVDLIYIGYHVQGLSWAWSPWYMLPWVLYLPGIAWGLRWAWKATETDDSLGDDLRHGEHVVQRVDEVAPDINTAPGVVTALAEALKAPKDVRRRWSVVGQDLTWDANHRWRTLTVQMVGKTVAQAQAAQDAVAGHLFLPADWLVLDHGGNASQVVMHMAGKDPYPSEPTPSPFLQNLAGDVWVPQRIGLDLFGLTPQELTLIASSIGIGGDTGTGKTALERLLAVLILSDPRAILDLWDFKGDGALSMFAPLAGEYSSSDEDEAIERFLCYLLDRKRDLRARSRLLAELGEGNREAVRDAKITRELAHRTDIDLRPRFTMADEIQDALNHPRYGEEITQLVIYTARKGRSGGTKLILATQNWDVKTVTAEVTNVLSTRISLRQPTYAASAQILGGKGCKYRADLLPDVHGAAVVNAAGDGAGVKGAYRAILDYVDAVQAQDACTRLAALRAPTPATNPARPEPPRVLVEMARLLSEPTRDGRMPSVEMAAAMIRYEIIAVTDDDRANGKGKTEEQLRQEKLAELLRPWHVRTRPDPANGNRAAYWLDKVDSRGNQVGVGPALAEARRGGASQPPSRTGHTGSRPGVRPGVRRLRSVDGA